MPAPAPAPAPPPPPSYPPLRRDEDAVDHFRSASSNLPVPVPDPYHWLHSPPSQSPDTQAFVNQQAALTRSYLDPFTHRHSLLTALRRSWDFARFSCHSLKKDGFYYFSYNSGLQPQSAIYRVHQSSAQEPIPPSHVGPAGELFLDPNRFSSDGTVALASLVFSHSASLVAYALSRSGSDWSEIYVRSTQSPHPSHPSPDAAEPLDPGRLEDVVRFVKFSCPVWAPDDSGFFYQSYPSKTPGSSQSDEPTGTHTDPNLNAKLYFHKLGTPQEADILIIEDTANPEYMWGVTVTDDKRYLALVTHKDSGRSNRLWIADLQSQPLGSNMTWHKVADDFSGEFQLRANDGPRLYILTNKDASNGKMVTYDLDAPQNGFQDLIPEDTEATLEAFHPVHNDKVVVAYSRHVKEEIYIYELASGKLIKRIGDDLIGSCTQITGRREHDHFFFSFTSFLSPGTVYKYSFDRPEGPELETFRRSEVEGFDPNEFVSSQVFYNSKDGTRVPMFITHHKSVKRDGTAPVLQYGYGGFTISVAPFFSPSFMTFARHFGAVLAVPNIRGGGEYGEDWHTAGCFERKQNVFDDFEWATKYLVNERYGAPDKVTIMGASNGGLLVAACVNQSPDLYGAALAEVGVLDMLRFHKFTIGRAWMADYGDPDDPVAFDYIYKYSPLHNIKPDVAYPAMMLLTADHDDRVVPLHSFKYAAAVQHTHPQNPKPLLLRVDLKAGHGAGKSTEKKILEAVDKLSFVALSLGLEWIP